MAKLKAPLFSLGATGQLGKALVFFPWKGLNLVREHVVPANPKTTAQTTQRGYMTDAVAHIHTHQAEATHPIDEEDIRAYALLASTLVGIMTWFNAAIKMCIDNRILNVAYRNGSYADGHLTPGVDQLTFEAWFEFDNPISAGTLYYGTSKTALINTIAATVAGNKISKVITGLTTGVKYYVQFRATAPASTVAIRSGIYYGTPT